MAKQDDTFSTVVDQKTTVDDKTKIYESSPKASDKQEETDKDKTEVHEKTVLEDKLDSKLAPLSALSSQLTVAKTEKTRSLQPAHWLILMVVCLLAFGAVLLLKDKSLLKPNPQAKTNEQIQLERMQTTSTSKPVIIKTEPKPDKPKDKPKDISIASLSIQTVPKEARIEVNLQGKTVAFAGSFNNEFELKEKEVKIPVIISYEGYKTREIDFVLNKKNLIITEIIELEKIKYGTVRISARPWGTAKIKGLGSRSLPTTVKVPTGAQVVSVYYPPTKKGVSKTIQVKEGKTINCRASFSKTKSFIYCKWFFKTENTLCQDTSPASPNPLESAATDCTWQPYPSDTNYPS